jgi:hypothetical protein
MKKILVVSFVAVLILFVWSCKKSSSAPAGSAYFISATVGGTSRTFNVSAYAVDSSIGGASEIDIFGLSDSSFTPAAIVLSISNSPGLKSITTGAYTDTTASFTLSSSYYSNYYASTSFNAGTVFAATASGAGITITNHLKLVITSLTSTGIKGTFSGDYYFDGDPSASPTTITNGSFYLKFK